MNVAGRKLANIALAITQSERPSSAVESHGGDTDSLERQRAVRLSAIKYVVKTGLPYRPLIDKWKRK